MGRRRADERYVYDTRLLQYRDQQTGRMVKQSFVDNIVEQRITEGFEKLEDYAAAIIDGGVGDIADFEVAFLTELRNMHGQMSIIGNGGLANMGPAEWGKLGNVLRDEYGFARDFMQQIANGDVSRAQLSARMKMYSNKIYHSYWNGRTNSAEKAGFDEERRVLQPAEHCDDCLGLAAKGWQSLGSLPDPADGSTECRSNCRCVKHYRNSTTGVVTSTV